MRYLFILFILLFSPLHSFGESPKELVGQIGFDELRIENVIIGIEPYEREIGQDLLVDMRISFDFSDVTASDRLEYTVDYVQLADIAKSTATEGRYYFIDVLGVDILRHVFQTYPEVVEASIKIQKEAAIPEAKSGGVIEISLTREEFTRSENNGKIMGKIGFDQLLVSTVIGDLPIERENFQDLYVNVRVTIDLKELAETSDIQSTVNYVEMAKLFSEVAHKGQYQMIETLAVMYLRRLHENYPKIDEAYILIRKPGTLPGYPFKSDAVTELTL